MREGETVRVRTYDDQILRTNVRFVTHFFVRPLGPCVKKVVGSCRRGHTQIGVMSPRLETGSEAAPRSRLQRDFGDGPRLHRSPAWVSDVPDPGVADGPPRYRRAGIAGGARGLVGGNRAGVGNLQARRDAAAVNANRGHWWRPRDGAPAVGSRPGPAPVRVRRAHRAAGRRRRLHYVAG